MSEFEKVEPKNEEVDLIWKEKREDGYTYNNRIDAEMGRKEMKKEGSSSLI